MVADCLGCSIWYRRGFIDVIERVFVGMEVFCVFYYSKLAPAAKWRAYVRRVGGGCQKRKSYLPIFEQLSRFLSVAKAAEQFVTHAGFPVVRYVCTSDEEGFDSFSDLDLRSVACVSIFQCFLLDSTSTIQVHVLQESVSFPSSLNNSGFHAA